MNINYEQNKIVTSKPNGAMAIKGVAGSGKTTISVYRARYLLDKYCPEFNDKVLIVSYNKTLVSYIKAIYKSIPKSLEKELNFLKNHNSNNLEIINVDKLSFRYFRKYLNRTGKNLKILSRRNATFTYLDQAIDKIKNSYKGVNLLERQYRKFLIEEISWMKSCNINSLEEYQTIDRLGRSSSEEGPSRLQKNSMEREFIYILKDKYDDLLMKDGYIDFETMNLLALKELEKSREEGYYTHILIDEAQDLSKVQLEFLLGLYKNKNYSSINFAIDNTQSIYTNSWLGRGRSYTSIGLDMTGRMRTLNKNYRTTTQISKAAYSLVAEDEYITSNIDYVEPKYYDRQGEKPIYKHFRSDSEQIEYIADEIELLLKEYRAENIAIVYRTTINAKKYSEYLKQRNINNQILADGKAFLTGSVKLTTLHSIKGLEFDVVFIADINQGVIPNDYFRNGIDEDIYRSDERKLMYVGMTRAKHLLYLSSFYQKSDFIHDIDFEHLSLERSKKFRPFREIYIDDYVFKYKLDSHYSKEEKVRQWLLNELMETYNYPLSNLDIEYELVDDFKQFYVDIVIKDDSGNPKVFIETKQEGYDLEEAKKQLLRYMNLSDVKLGLVTDGRHMEIIDNLGKEIEDLDVYKVKNRKLIRFNDISEKTLENEETFTYKLPVIGDVAAGPLKLAEENFSEYVDYKSLKNHKNDTLFALKVTGDSMIDAGIDVGDLAVIKSQNTAERGDIVVARVNDEASLKSFDQAGDMIILTPENKEYEPMIYSSAHVEIDGVLVDIIKF